MESRNYIIGFLNYQQHPVNRTYTQDQTQESNKISLSLVEKNSTLKSHDHESESCNKFKNVLLKITQLSPWQITFGHFFARCAIFVRHHFLWVSYLPIAGGVFSCAIFVRCHYFQIALKGAIFIGCISCLLNSNYLLFYQQFEERLVSKHGIKIV